MQRRVVIAALCAAGIGAPCVGLAQSEPAGARFAAFAGVGVGGYWSDESFRGNGIAFGGGLGAYALRSRLGVELTVHGGTHSRRFDSGVAFDGTLVYVAGNLTFAFAESGVRPYMTVGAGFLHAETNTALPGAPGAPPDLFTSEDDGPAFNVGGGILIPVTSIWFIRPDARLTTGSTDAITHHYRVAVSLGAMW